MNYLPAHQNSQGFKPPATLRAARRAAGGRGAAREGRPVFQGRTEGQIAFSSNHAEQY
jgi:hypothetical protein